MSRYVPLTPAERERMLRELDLADENELFDVIPRSVRDACPGSLSSLPDEGLTESRLSRRLASIEETVPAVRPEACFLGAGMYARPVPAVIDALTSRAEFYTAYTPYQAEVSQGTLQAIYEYQSLVCALTGMEVSNASMYDGATAAAEAMLLARNVNRKGRFAVSSALNPLWMKVLRTYAAAASIELIELPWSEGSGRTVMELPDALEVDGVLVQSPNFFGVIENLAALRGLCDSLGAGARKPLMIVACEPVSLGLLKPPGEFGADVVVGDAAGTGMPPSFGGPTLGFMCVTRKLTRKIPGRVAGRTKDRLGRRAFVLTLQAREQHIRRASACSNICSNEALCALSFAIHLCLLGKHGLKRSAEYEFHASHYAAAAFAEAGFEVRFGGPFFNEFVVDLGCDVSALNESLLDDGIVGGCDLGRMFPSLSGCMLVACAEAVEFEAIDEFVGKVVSYGR